MTDMSLKRNITATLDAVRTAGLKKLGRGCGRIVFALNDRHILKVPVDEDGCFDNDSEARQWRQRQQCATFPIARCRILMNRFGVPLLVMERVSHPMFNGDVPGEPPAQQRLRLPKWAFYVDCCQVGYTRKGVLVAYDYSGHRRT